jgi:hypothetical protein
MDIEPTPDKPELPYSDAVLEAALTHSMRELMLMLYSNLAWVDPDDTSGMLRQTRLMGEVNSHFSELLGEVRSGPRAKGPHALGGMGGFVGGQTAAMMEAFTPLLDIVKTQAAEQKRKNDIAERREARLAGRILEVDADDVIDADDKTVVINADCTEDPDAVPRPQWDDLELGSVKGRPAEAL